MLVYTFIQRMNVSTRRKEKEHTMTINACDRGAENELSFRLSNHGAKLLFCTKAEFTFNLVHFGLKTIFVGVLSIYQPLLPTVMHQLSYIQYIHLPIPFGKLQRPLWSYAWHGLDTGPYSTCYIDELNNRINNYTLYFFIV